LVHDTICNNAYYIITIKSFGGWLAEVGEKVHGKVSRRVGREVGREVGKEVGREVGREVGVGDCRQR
jgi:tetrahydromethanopterin S-methyltransferase subunit G